MSVSKWLINRISRADGLPSTQVHHSAGGAFGQILIASPAGLAIHDGVSTTVLTTRDGLDCDGLRWVGTDIEGCAWVGSDVGYAFVDAEGVIHTPDPERQPGLVTSGLVDGDSCILATASGCFRVTGRGSGQELSFEASKLEVNDDSTVLLLASDGRGTALAADSRHRIHRWDGVSWAVLPHQGYRICGPIRVMAVDSPDTMLIGGASGFCRTTRDGDLLSFVPIGDFGGPVAALVRRNSDVLAAIGTTLLTFEPDMNGELKPSRVLSQNMSFNHLWMDSGQNVWGSTHSDGLIKISGLDRFITFPKLPHIGAVFAIRRRRSGALLLGGENGILVPSGLGQDAGYQHLLPGVRAWDVLQTSIGETIAATDEGVLVVDSDNVSTPFVPGSRRLAERSRALINRSDGVWVGTIKGLVRVQNSVATPVVDPDGDQLGYVYSLWENRTKQLWITTLGRGLWHETEKGIERFTNAPFAPTSNVYAIDESDDGHLAIIANSTLFIGQRDGSPDDWLVVALGCQAWAVAFDGPDILLIGTSDGLSIHDGRTGRRRSSVRPSLGPEAWEFTTSRSLVSGLDGRILCGVTSGLIAVDVGGLLDLEGRPIPHLAGIRWVGASPSVSASDGTITVGVGQWALEIIIRSSWRVDESECSISCQIVGFNHDWTRSADSGQFWFTSLPAGEYIIRAQVHSPLAGPGPLTDLVTLGVVAEEA